MGGLKIPFWKRHHPISGSRKSKRLSCGGEQAVGILNDDFGESDDNLSFRSISERESSPVSMAVSPVGSIGGDTDGGDPAPRRAAPPAPRPHGGRPGGRRLGRRERPPPRLARHRRPLQVPCPSRDETVRPPFAVWPTLRISRSSLDRCVNRWDGSAFVEWANGCS